jgi:hypothetical protein
VAARAVTAGVPVLWRGWLSGATASFSAGTSVRDGSCPSGLRVVTADSGEELQELSEDYAAWAAEAAR